MKQTNLPSDLSFSKHELETILYSLEGYIQGNNDEALLSFNEVYVTDVDNRVKGSAATFSLRAIYKDNIFGRQYLWNVANG